MPASRVYLEAQGSEFSTDVGFSSSFTDEGEWKTADGSFCTPVLSKCIYLGGRARHPHSATPLHPGLMGSAVLSAAAQRASRSRQTPRTDQPDRSLSRYRCWILPEHTASRESREGFANRIRHRSTARQLRNAPKAHEAQRLWSAQGEEDREVG